MQIERNRTEQNRIQNLKQIQHTTMRQANVKHTRIPKIVEKVFRQL